MKFMKRWALKGAIWRKLFRLEVYLKRGGSKISKICKKQFGEKEVYTL